MATKKRSTKTTTKKSAAPKPAAKSTTKKAAPKKPAAKKSATKTTTKASPASKSASTKKSSASKKPALVNASPEQAFWTTNGEILNNLKELSEALDRMQAEVFSHHVTKERNDFAEWVEHVLADAACAAALRKAKKPAAAKTIVIRFVKKYNV